MAPRSMPAGLSQRIQSNLVRSSAMMLPTPASVRASLSLVWDAGSSHKFSRRLSRIRACESFATPCTTLIRSNTTRRSAPRTRSRFRRPTSKSTTTTFSPICASAAPSAAVEVVLPTPPLPDVTTRTLAILISLAELIEWCDFHDVAFQPCLSRTIAQGDVYFFSRLVVAVDGEQLGFDLLAENPRGRVAAEARHRTAAKRSIDMDGPAGDNLGTGADRAQHGHIALAKDRLAGAHRAVQHQRRRLRFGFRLLGFARREHAVASAGQQRRHARGQAGGIHILETQHANVPLFQACDEVSDSRLAEVNGG